MELQHHILKNGQQVGGKVTILLALQLSLLFLTGCWYIAITRHYTNGDNLGKIYEWRFSVTVSAFYRADKKDFVKNYGRTPNEFYDYKTHVTFGTVAKIDTMLSDKERHDVRIDSVKISFENFAKVFHVLNSFEDNLKQRMDAYTYVSVGSIYIPPGIQQVDVTVYGMFRSSRVDLEPFELSARLRYKEISERISKYD